MLPDPFTLYAGDCFELMRSLPDGCIDALITDPPFGTTNLAFDKAARKNKIDWTAWWEEAHRVTKPTGIVCCFAAQPFTTDLINANRKNFRYAMVWAKPHAVGFLTANQRPLRAHEDILVFCQRFGPRRIRQGEHLVRQAQSVYNPQFTHGHAPYLHHYRAAAATHYSATKALPDYQNDGRRHPTSVLTYGRDVPSTHPTAKPLALAKFLIRSFTHPGQIVLDPFAGGGSIPVAALEEGRRVIASELDPVYLETIRQRTQGYTINEIGAPLPARGV